MMLTLWTLLTYLAGMTSATDNAALVRFMHTLSAASLTLARELEAGDSLGGLPASLDDAGLGTLQLPVAKAPGMDSGHGVTPREIARHIGRTDEPNIRTALAALKKRGVAELATDAKPQRWRLTARYRTATDA